MSGADRRGRAWLPRAVDQEGRSDRQPGRADKDGDRGRHQLLGERLHARRLRAAHSSSRWIGEPWTAGTRSPGRCRQDACGSRRTDASRPPRTPLANAAQTEPGGAFARSFAARGLRYTLVRPPTRCLKPFGALFGRARSARAQLRSRAGCAACRGAPPAVHTFRLSGPCKAKR